MRSTRRLTWNTAWPSILGILLLCRPYSRADQTDMLFAVRAGHRAAKQSIHSFSATVNKKITFQKQGSIKIIAKYWRSLDIVRVRETYLGTMDMLLKDGEIRQVARSAGPKQGQVQYHAKRRAAVQDLCQCDVWETMQIDHAGPDGGRYDFDSFLAFAKGPPLASRVKEAGRDCVRLKLSVVSAQGTESYVTLWHDVDHNYLVWKKKITNNKSSSGGDKEILEFAEPEPGVFVPIKCLMQSYGENGEPSSRAEITLTDVEVNKPIPASALQLPAIPSGTLMDDEISGTSYLINENWEAIGPSKPYRKLVVPVEAADAGSGYPSQSSSEARPLSRLLIPASLLALVIACAGLTYRRYKSRSKLRHVD